MYEAVDFQKEWAKLGYSDEDYEKLTDYLTDNPGVGNMIPGTGGVMKLRWPAPGDRGKRGGSRVIYFARNQRRFVYFVMVYSMNNKLDLTEIQKRTLRVLIKQM